MNKKFEELEGEDFNYENIKRWLDSGRNELRRFGNILERLGLLEDTAMFLIEMGYSLQKYKHLPPK